MALKWIDGFESYGTTVGNSATGFAPSKYSSGIGSFTIRAGRVAGKAISFSGFAQAITPSFTAQDTWTVGFGLLYMSLGSEQEIFRWRDSTTVQCSLTILPNGELAFWRGTFGINVKLGTTSGAKLKAGVWSYVEVKVKVHNTTGTVDIHVNGSSVLSLSSQNTRQGSNNQATNFIMLGSSTGADRVTFDDLYICDNQGSNNTTFLSPQKVTMIAPTGDNGTNQWSPTGAGTTHADRVKENPHDSNTTYLSETVSGNTEEFDYANTGSEVASIKGVQQNTVFETDDASPFSVNNHVKSGATTLDDGGAAGTNGTYTTSPFLVETDPNTSALWTKSNLDAALFGVKLV